MIWIKLSNQSQKWAFQSFCFRFNPNCARSTRTASNLAYFYCCFRTYLIAAQILGANEKGDTKITVKVLGDGAMGRIIAVADSKGHVKGYVKIGNSTIKSLYWRGFSCSFRWQWLFSCCQRYGPQAAL